MDDAFPLLFFVAVMALVAGAFVWERHARKKRIEEMQALAGLLGYDYDGGADMTGVLGGFGLLSRGHSHRTGNLLSQEAGDTTTCVFDWSFTVGHGKHRTTYNQSVLYFESARLDLPSFTLRPEGLGSKIKGMLGEEDIDFADQSEFSKAYLLEGPDEPQVRALFDPATIAFFVRHRRGLYLYGHGPKLLYYRSGERHAPARIPAFIDDGLAILGVLARQAAAPAVGPDRREEEAAPTAEEPDPLAGLDEVLAEMGVDVGEAPAGAVER